MGLFRRKHGKIRDEELAIWFDDLAMQVEQLDIDDPRQRQVYRAAAFGGALAVARLLRSDSSPFAASDDELPTGSVASLLGRGRWTILLHHSAHPAHPMEYDDAEFERAVKELDVGEASASELRRIWVKIREQDRLFIDEALAEWLVSPIIDQQRGEIRPIDLRPVELYINEGALAAHRLLDEDHPLIQDR